MELGFALVPVLAGYWLLTRTHLFKHRYDSRTHHRVVFEPAVFGGLLLFVSWMLASTLTGVFASAGQLGWVGDAWRRLAPFEHSAVLALTAAIAVAIPPIVNRKVDAAAAANRWALMNETPRGWLLRRSFERGTLVEVSLGNGQSHIGFVSSLSRFDFERDVALAPDLSGYRDPATRKLVITTEYDDQDDEFRIVCRLEEVTSVSHFDPLSRYVEWAIP